MQLVLSANINMFIFGIECTYNVECRKFVIHSNNHIFYVDFYLSDVIRPINPIYKNKNDFIYWLFAQTGLV